MNVAEDQPREEADSPYKDSGFESLTGSSEDEGELTQRIVALVEFYFSDEYILHDSFLLKHVRRNREGYVSLKLMASLRKVKTLTKSWEVVRKAIRSSSTRLEVNTEGTKVRRLQPLPDVDETGPSRTVLAYPLPVSVTVDAVTEMFSRCGPISELRLLRPGAAVPPHARRFFQRHPETTGCSTVLVEFEVHQGACQALRQSSPFLRVVPLAPNPSTTAVLADMSATGSPMVEDRRTHRPVVPSWRAVSPSVLCPQNKSQQSQGDVTAGPWVKKRSECHVLVLRQPRGPDGTRGFHHLRETKECKMPAAAP